MRTLVISLLAVFLLAACQKKQNGNIDPDSVFNLQSSWEQPDGSKIKLENLKGKVLTMVMIYTSCKTACPRLTADMKEIEAKVGHTNTDDLKYVLVSIDPEHDTPEKMRDFIKNNGLEGKQWVFLRGNEEDTRELANVLAVKYKKITPMDFSHSNIISVFSKAGTLVHQKEGLSIDINTTVDEIKKELKK
ncbi:electron transporter SenC [Elizabethkingia meningoseptica]|uniref:SCO family protein n=1 Tax=Elizabethkingia meningoseptica TaxID=238 RepID=UPI000999AA1E|nr:SCO family protein [Elizabethkingia meningoseptica]OPC33458.1 electron transporter SenC [Elizabethkingia meningoseptica]